MEARTKLSIFSMCFLVAVLPATLFAQTGSIVRQTDPWNICAGQTISLAAVCPGGSGSLDFSAININDYSIVSSGNGSAVVKFLHPGTFEVKANYTGCNNSTSSIFVTIHPQLSNLPTSSQVWNFTDYDEVTLSIGGFSNPVDWYTGNNELLGTGASYVIGALQPGTYVYVAKILNPHGCAVTGITPAATVTVNVTSGAEDLILNWTETIAFNESDTVSHSIAYFDLAGEALQAQSKSFATNTIHTSTTLKDEYDRTVGSTLPIPLQKTSFSYEEQLLRNQSGTKYKYQNLGQSVDQNTPGTIGWYYSSQNTLEENVPATAHPYSRVTFYNDGTTEQKMSGGVGEVLGIGSGHEVISGSFPVFSELEDYLSKRVTAIPGIVQDNNLRNEGVVNIGRDQNGKYAISVTDREGKTVMTALPASQSDQVISITNEITSSGDPESPNFRQSTYFYLLNEQPVTISGASNFVVENIITDEQKTGGQTFAGADGKWPVGFYRIILDTKNKQITLTYTNYFKDLSYQFYDDAGRLVTSVSPNGMLQLKQGTAFNLIDKTDYLYNFRGWLLETKEPDAGLSKFKYRKDGSIRFSQNAQQATTNRFSYTAYDQLGRPVESGEYIGTQKTYASSVSELEFANQVGYPASDKKDWIKTTYDVPDQEFVTAWPNAPYKQTYIRGGVSASQNANNKTWYSYDDMGRSTWIARKPTNLNLLFVTTYQYDFLGNVLRVSNFTYDWQTHAVVNEFHHHYEYDADQRLDKAYTSLTQGGTKKLRATYFYYLHGPLKRIELGDKLQGIDFVYNIQGWLTQINHPLKSEDPGHDTNDAFGMILDYYESDIPNLLSGKVSPQNPLRHHGLTEEMMASHTYKQPLPRFAPDVPQQDAGLEPPLKKYSAENAAYQQMISTTVPSHN